MIVKHVILSKSIRNFKLVEMLTVISWQNILFWGGKAYPSVVAKMFSSIVNVNMVSNTFDLRIVNQVKSLNTNRISALMRVPPKPNGHTSVLFVTEDDRHQNTIFLCGIEARWKNSNALPIAHLFSQFRILHNIFTSNVYPHKGNKTKLTAFMASILYRVGSKIPTSSFLDL